MSRAKRRKLKEATVIDRGSAGVVNIAVQTAHALMDTQKIAEIEENIADNVPTYTLSPHEAGEKHNPFQGIRNTIAWVDKRNRDHTLTVNGPINGADAAAFAEYPNDPEMARLVVKRTIQRVGVFAQNSEIIQSKDDPDVAIILAGTQTLPAIDAVAGAIAVVDVPPLGAEDPRVGSSADGTGCKVQTLIVRPKNATLVGVQFQRTVAHLTSDPETWRRAMTGYGRDANAWLNAAQSTVESHTFTGLLMVKILVDAGLLSVRGVNNDGIANAELHDAAGQPLTSLELMSRLAQALNLTPNSTVLLDPKKHGEYQLIRLNFARQAFYIPNPVTGAMNLANELGARYDPLTQTIVSSARVPETRQLRQGSWEAELVAMQTNHHVLATAGVVEAVNEDERAKLGVFLTNSSDTGSGQAQLSLNIAS